MNLQRYIRFSDHDDLRGYARVSLPQVDKCPVCGGCRWVRHNGQLIHDPAAATALAYIRLGYELRREESETQPATCSLSELDSHEGLERDYWQKVPDLKPCRCNLHNDLLDYHNELLDYLNDNCTEGSLTESELAECPHPGDEALPTPDEIAATEARIERVWAEAA